MFPEFAKVDMGLPQRLKPRLYAVSSARLKACSTQTACTPSLLYPACSTQPALPSLLFPVCSTQPALPKPAPPKYSPDTQAGTMTLRDPGLVKTAGFR